MTLSPQTAQALLEAAKEAQRKFAEARNTISQKGAFKLIGQASDIIDTAIASAEREIQEGKG